MRMPYQDALRIIAKGREKDFEKRLWDQYVSIYPYMNEENFISFEEFKDKTVKPVESTRTKEDVLGEVEGIIEMTL